ncbi:MAG: hypothetical protein ACW98I_06270 [Candidatus Hodarchaeales archaeon]|jgi:hypothetical protein
MASQDYNPWIGQEMKKLIDLIVNKAFQTNPDSINAQIEEIRRGLEYGLNNPGAIDDLVMKVARNFVDSFQVYMRQAKRPNTGIPPGGTATVLTGGTFEDTPSTQTDQFSVDELKGALASRKKQKVEKKMKGSMDLLKDYEQ